MCRRAFFFLLILVVGVSSCSEDQETAKQALADIQADNDEGHRRLQAKLAAAAKR